MNLVRKLEKSKSFWFLVFASFIFFVLRLPSLFEPDWYSDEGVYQAVGMLIRAGHPLYSGGWENKPPLLLALYASLNSDLILVRAASLIFGLASIWFFYFISKKLFNESDKLAAITTAIYTLIFGSILIEGNIANAENFMLLPILAGAYAFLHALTEPKGKQIKLLFLSGFLISFAFLTKIVAVFDFIAFGAYLLYANEEKISKLVKEKILPYVGGFILPVLVTTVYFAFTNNIKDFLNAFIFQNVGYVGVENQFIIPQGLLYIKILILLIFSGLIYWKRKSFSKSFLFITLWFGFSLFDVFFSQRPYTHYLIMLLPSFCLLVGLIIYDKKWKAPLIMLLALSFFLVIQNFSFQTKIINYYQNFIQYCQSKKTATAFQAFFDPNTPRDYAIAEFVKANTMPKDSIFIWGDNPQLYKLADKTPITRYVASYHMTFYPTGISEMNEAIKNKKPKLIIIVPNTKTSFPGNLQNYKQAINISGATVYERQL